VPFFVFLLAVVHVVCSENLLQTVKNGTVNDVRKVIEEGADVNALGKEDLTALHVAARYNPDPEVISLLIKAGAKVNATDYWLHTPLKYAVAHNENPDIIQTLLDAGAHYDPGQNKGWTLLHHAASFNPHPEIIDFFLHKGKNVNAHEKNFGDTPLHNAVKNNTSLSVIESLIDAGAEVNSKNDDDMTPLFMAVVSNPNPEIIAALLDAGANSREDRRFREEKSLLYWAIQQNKSPDVIRFLIAKTGYDINQKIKDGKTLLHLALFNSNPDVILCLLEIGADPNIEDNNGLTVWDYYKGQSWNEDSEAYKTLEKMCEKPGRQ